MGAVAFDAALVLASFVAMGSWFTTRLLGRPATLVLAAAILAAVLARERATVRAFRPDPRVLAVCALGLLLRAPAFVEPASVVGADGSLQAMLANVILRGAHPAPVFLETSSYQGSLKAHLGALASLFVGRGDPGLLVVIGSTALWVMGIVATMSIGRRLGGTFPAVTAGLFVALSPRFATVFSVNNIGEYPDAIGLGTWAMAWAMRLLDRGRGGASARGSYFGIGLLMGIALWQQPIAASFGLAAMGVLALRAIAARDAWFLSALFGLFLGRLPVTLYDLSATSSNAQAVGSFLRVAGRALPLEDHVRGTIGWAFPVMFTGLSTDAGWPESLRVTLGLVCVAVILIFAFRALLEAKRSFALRAWDLTRLMVLTQFAAGLAFVWLVAGGGVYARPRYFLPLLPAFALAFADLANVLRSRSRSLGVVLVVVVIGWNSWSNIDRMHVGFEEGRAMRRLAGRIEDLGLRTGYSGVAAAGPLMVLTNERVSVDGILDTVEGERLPARHTEKVRRYGPDFYLADAEGAERVAARLKELGVTYSVEAGPLVLFHHLSRRVPLEEVQSSRP